jgi:L-fuconolactonase
LNPVRIDAHQHFWRIARGDYGWLTPALAPIHRDFLAADLAPLLAEAGIERTILVQAAPTLAETEFLLELAARTRSVAGVVGWVDFAGPDAADRIAGLAKDPLLVGLRPMVQDIADDDWLLRADLAPAFDALVAHDLVLDALVLPRHLSRLLVVLDRHPRLAVVVDHAAKPEIAEARHDPSRHDRWRADMAAVAARPGTTCKLSGLVTEAGPGWTVAMLRPVVDHLLGTFGAARLLWGSDWPVVTLAASYQSWLVAAAGLTDHLGADEKAAVFGGNAARIYLTKRGRRS